MFVAALQEDYTEFVADTGLRFSHSRLMLSHAEILAELQRRRDTGALRNRDIEQALSLPSSRVSEIFSGKRALNLDEARKLTAAFDLADAAPKPMRPDLGRLRRSRGLTVAQLAKLMEDRPDTIKAIEAGDTALTPEWAERIAPALGISARELLATGEYTAVRRVPLVGSIPGGNWREAIGEPLALVPCEDGGPNTFALTVSGNSMGRVAPDGSRIYIDPDDIDLVDKGLYAIMRPGGDTTFKRYRSPTSELEPVTDEPGHEPIKIGRQPFTIVGRVVGGWVRFR